MRDFLQKMILPKGLFVLALGVYFIFAFSHLGQFVTADEEKWTYERIPQYFEAWRSLDLEETFINDKPGVSVALLGLPAILMYPDSEEHCVEGKDKIITCAVGDSESLYLAFRIPLIIVNGLLLIFLFFCISRITNSWIGLWSAILIGFSPPLIGISQIVNPDALLWSFASASIFSYFWWLKSGTKLSAFSTATWLGFALLSKYVACILIPFYLGVAILRFLILDDDELASPREMLLRDLKMLALSTGLALVILVVFLPALVLDVDRVGDFLATIEGKGLLFGVGAVPLLAFLLDTYLLQSRGLFFIRNICRGKQYLFSWSVVLMFGTFVLVGLSRLVFPEAGIFTIVRFDQKELTNAIDILGRALTWYEALILNISPVLYALTPVTLLGFLFLVLEMKKKRVSSYYFFALCIAFFFFLYELILLYTNVLATIRYSVILYPLIAFLGALGFSHLGKQLPFRHKEIVLTGLIVFGSLISLFAIKPFYFNYTNFLLPKSHIITDAWGYGGYEAAAYLNSLPDAKNLTVWADYYGVCEFFVGRCLTAYNFDRETVTPDYYVLTRRGRIRYWSRYETWERNSALTAYQYYDKESPEWEMFIGHNPKNMIRVVKVVK